MRHNQAVDRIPQTEVVEGRSSGLLQGLLGRVWEQNARAVVVVPNQAPNVERGGREFGSDRGGWPRSRASQVVGGDPSCLAIERSRQQLYDIELASDARWLGAGPL